MRVKNHCQSPLPLFIFKNNNRVPESSESPGPPQQALFWDKTAQTCIYQPFPVVENKERHVFLGKREEKDESFHFITNIQSSLSICLRTFTPAPEFADGSKIKSASASVLDV